MHINELFAQHQPTVIYVGDPMCSWCYGFAPEISEVRQRLADTIDFQLVMGGLRPHGTQTMAELKEFLTHHWEDVAKRSGQPFSYNILDSSDLVYDTEPACRATVTMRALKPESEFDYFKDLQTSFYYENEDPSSAAHYAGLAMKYGLDSTQFNEAFESDSMKKATWEDFALARELQANSFPCVLVYYKEQYFLVARGYLEADKLEKNILSAINSVASKN